jgi:ferredoxin-NADP reductase/Na+-translocating ferredoxin:NAD+ oxidoreductase RnfD subunit
MDVIKLIDSVLDRITMYRVVLYYLIGLGIAAMVLSSIGILPYDPVHIVLSALFFVFFSEWINDVFSRVFKAPVNVESTTITALILFCIVPPVGKLSDFVSIAAISALAVSSKYLLAIKNKHIFNPVALAVFVSALAFREPATWWIGNPVMTVFVVLGGLLVVRKIRRGKMVSVFIGTVLVISTIFTLLKGSSLPVLYSRLMFHSSLLFFAFVMLTEPMTSPPSTDLQIAFAALIGFLFVPDIHIGVWYTTPEMALLMGNIYAYVVSPKDKMVLSLREKIAYSSDIMDFVFTAPRQMKFIAGQYMEWTLPHDKPDSRGNRRYFTLASSPTEQEIRVGVKFYENSSSYKKALSMITKDTPLVVAQLAGEFTLPRDQAQKIVFIAGGIGVTPYRSILKYLIDQNEKRDIVLMYANKLQKDIVYQDVFIAAYRQLGVRTVYTLTDTASVPAGWSGQTGRINADMIAKEIPDYAQRLFYLSGPFTMVRAFEQTLHELGIPRTHIKKDFFPGLA